MLSSLGTPSTDHLPSIADAGVLVFVPWYLLRNSASVWTTSLIKGARTDHRATWING